MEQLQLRPLLGRTSHVIFKCTLRVGHPKTALKVVRNFKEVDIRRLRERTLQLLWGTNETSAKSLWWVIKETPLEREAKWRHCSIVEGGNMQGYESSGSTPVSV